MLNLRVALVAPVLLFALPFAAAAYADLGTAFDTIGAAVDQARNLSDAQQAKLTAAEAALTAAQAELVSAKQRADADAAHVLMLQGEITKRQDEIAVLKVDLAAQQALVAKLRVFAPAPTAVLTATPPTIKLGESSKLKLDATNYELCRTTSWDMQNPVVTPQVTTKYQGECAGLNGAMLSFDATVAVEIPSPPPPDPVPVPPPPPAPGPQACMQGQAVPTPAAVILPPAVPQPTQSGDVVGLILQNSATDRESNPFHTFGQVFLPGKVMPTDHLAARVDNKLYPAQLDALALHDDGSVRHAAVTLHLGLCAKQQVAVMLTKTGPDSGIPVDLASANVDLSVDFAFTAGGTTKKIDLGPALKQALAGKPDYWLRGPFATQARVEVPVPGTPTMRLTADVTAYADGNVAADVQFNNDITKVTASYGPALAPLAYTATINLNGQTQSYDIKQQVHYQDWHAILDTQGKKVPHVQADAAYLQKTGAALNYDLKTGVFNSTIQSFANGKIWVGYSAPFGSVKNPAYGTPLSANGVTQGMPNTGGRSDIGPTTYYSTLWFVTQDERVADVAKLWGDTGGAVPWNYKVRAEGSLPTKAPTPIPSEGRWLTPYDYPYIWADPRADRGFVISDFDNQSVSGWGPEMAHQPTLGYAPYLMTARRWYLDRLNAQAAWELSVTWFADRCHSGKAYFSCSEGNNTVLIDFDNQVRAQAWATREVMLAAWIGKTGSWEQQFFAKANDQNWTYALNETQDVTTQDGAARPGRASVARLGEPAGYIWYGTDIASWQQNYMTLIAAWGARLGYEKPRQFLRFQSDHWLTGQIIGKDMVPWYIGDYFITGANPTTRVPYKTWKEMAVAQALSGKSTSGVKYDPATGTFSGGTLNSWYTPWYRGTLGAALGIFPGDPNLTAAYKWLDDHVNPNLNVVNDINFYRNDPMYNIVPPAP